MSFLVALLQLITLAFGGSSLDSADGPKGAIQKQHLETLQTPGPINPCAAGCR